MAKPMPSWWKLLFAVSGILVAVTGLKKLQAPKQEELP